MTDPVGVDVGQGSEQLVHVQLTREGRVGRRG